MFFDHRASSYPSVESFPASLLHMAFERPWAGDPFNRLKVLAPPHLLSADKVRELGVLDGQLFRSLTVPTGSLQKLQAQPLLAGTESITPLKRAGYLVGCGSSPFRSSLRRPSPIRTARL